MICRRPQFKSLLIFLLISPATVMAADPVFSGPQVGETLTPFKVRGVLGDQAGTELDLIAAAAEQPVVLVFFHERTRPAFGLTNAIMRYAAQRSSEGLAAGVVFLTEDATATEKWIRQVEQHLAKNVTYGISVDGAEGPGTYGLNRNVALTILVGKDATVTANFALVQPSLQADGPKILQAIADALGGGEVPSISDLAGGRFAAEQRMMRNRGEIDPLLGSLVRAVINQQASPEEVQEAVAAVDKYVAENQAAGQQLGTIANRVVNSGRLASYGTTAAQQAIRQWAEEYGAEAVDRGGDTAPRE